MKITPESWEERWKNSELAERINATESFAILHGFPEWNKETVTDFIKKELQQARLLEREKMIGAFHIVCTCLTWEEIDKLKNI